MCVGCPGDLPRAVYVTVWTPCLPRVDSNQSLRLPVVECLGRPWTSRRNFDHGSPLQSCRGGDRRDVSKLRVRDQVRRTVGLQTDQPAQMAETKKPTAAVQFQSLCR